jgi:hypothetical protein
MLKLKKQKLITKKELKSFVKMVSIKNIDFKNLEIDEDAY